jgi:hypothetical protein
MCRWPRQKRLVGNSVSIPSAQWWARVESVGKAALQCLCVRVAGPSGVESAERANMIRFPLARSGKP